MLPQGYPLAAMSHLATSVVVVLRLHEYKVVAIRQEEFFSSLLIIPFFYKALVGEHSALSES